MNPLAIAFAVAALTAPNLASAYQRDSGDAGAGVSQPAVPGVDGQDDLDSGQTSAPALPYHHWTRGQTLPPAYRSAPIADYGRYHLRQPPYGYQWYRCGDQMVLASVDSGMIFEVIEDN